MEQGCGEGVRHILVETGVGGRRYVKWNSQSADDENKIWSAKIERYSIYFLRNHQTDVQSGCSSLQPHQQWRSVPLSPHPCQHLLSPEFLILAILTGVR